MPYGFQRYANFRRYPRRRKSYIRPRYNRKGYKGKYRTRRSLPRISNRRKALMGAIRMARGKPTVKKNAKKIALLNKYNESLMGLLKVRFIDTNLQSSPINQATNLFYYINDATSIENCLAQLRYYDPTTPGSLVTSNFNSGTYQKEVIIDYQSLKVNMMANYNVPVKYVAYFVDVKEDTSITALTAFTNGIPKMSNTTSNSIWISPSDVPLFKDLWTIKKTIKGIIPPGTVKSFYMKGGRFSYDPSLYDSHTLLFQKKFKARGIMIRIFGQIGHDNAVLNEVGRCDTECDVESIKKYNIKYNAGADIEFVYIADGSDNFTNAPNVCNRSEAKTQIPTL